MRDISEIQRQDVNAVYNQSDKESDSHRDSSLLKQTKTTVGEL